MMVGWESKSVTGAGVRNIFSQFLSLLHSGAESDHLADVGKSLFAEQVHYKFCSGRQNCDSIRSLSKFQ